MRHILLLALLHSLCLTSIHAQVGIGTTNPDASSILDITAIDKGVLVPKVSLSNISDTMLDGINPSAIGLLIYNTNATTVGGSGVGFYYFNGTVWERLITSLTASDDNDWYEEGTTVAPNTISDDKYTLGHIAIGKTIADYPLDILSDNSEFGTRLSIGGTDNLGRSGYYSIISNSGNGRQYGFRSSLNGNGTNDHGGLYNQLLGSGNGTQLGVYNAITNTGSGSHIGIDNLLAGNGNGEQFGMRSNLTNTGDGNHYGSYSTLSGIGTGTHYGNWTRLQGAGTGQQIGNFIDITNSGNSNHYVTYADISGAGTGYHYGSYLRFFGNNSNGQIGYFSLMNNSSNNPQYGANLQIGGNGNGAKYSASHIIYNSGNGYHYGTYNYLTGTGIGNKYGSYNDIPTTTGGTHYGIFSNVLKAGSYAGYFLGNVSIGTNAGNNYILPTSRGSFGQIIQTDGAGNLSWVDASSMSYWTRIGNVLNLTNAGDDIMFANDQTSITFPASNGTPAPMLYMFSGGTNNSNKMVLAHSTTYSNYGLQYNDADDSFRFLGNGVNLVEIDLTGAQVLSVVGNVNINGDIITDTTTYPDYVFESYYSGHSNLNETYTFKTLKDLEDYIKTHGHLPNVRSYEEVKANNMRIDVGQMTVTNLEKIEEAYLYIIELKKENDFLKAKLESQRRDIEEIKAVLQKQ